MRLITQSGSLVHGYGKSVKFSDEQLNNIFSRPKMSRNQVLSFARSMRIAISSCECSCFFSVLKFWKVLSTNLPLCHKNPRTSQPAWQIGSIRIAVQASEKHYDSGVLYYGRKCIFLLIKYVHDILFFLMSFHFEMAPTILGHFGNGSKSKTL